MRKQSTTASGTVSLIAVLFLTAMAASTAVAQDENPAGDSGEAPADTAAPADDAAPTGEGAADGATPTSGAAPTDNSTAPVGLRLRSLEQRVQALKERAWRSKARVGMLKEAVLGGGIGARASIVHRNKMGSKFRLIKLVYALDGTQIFARSDDASGKLHSSKRLEVLTGPISPGSHTISVLAIYRGHGYGVFRYLNKYKFTVRSSHTFTAAEGKATSIEVLGFERGGMTTPMEKRPALDFKVSVIQGGKKK
jgi:hypothetical protein